MAKSMRSKREKRLRAIRREIVEPFYDKKEEAKFAAQEAALAAPKLPMRSSISATNADNNVTDMATTMTTTTVATANTEMDVEIDEDVEMDEGNQSKGYLKPIGRKLKKKMKLSKKKRHGKGKIRRKRNV